MREVSSSHRRRSLDDYFEEAYEDETEGGIKWRYWVIMLSLGIANSSDASEILCLSYILSDDEFEQNILHASAWKAGFLASAVFLGMLLGGLIVGTLGDWLGRRPMLLVGLVCNAVAGVLSALTTNVWQLSALRCIAGVGIGATVPPLFTLVTELAPPSKRGAFITFCASFWMVGSIFVALVALLILEYWDQSWRVFAVACALPSALGALMVWTLVPESPRFLAIQQRQDEALREANMLALKMKFAGVLYTQTEILYYYPLEEIEQPFSHDPSANVVAWSCAIIAEGLTDFSKSTSKLYTPQLRQTTWPLQTIWFSLNFGSYGIMTWINSLFVAVHLENVYFNALLFATSNLPGNLLSGFLMDRTGRKCMLVSSSLAAALSLMTFALFARESESQALNTSGIVLSACFFQAWTIAAWNTIDCMTTERFPTSVRSTGMGVCAASGRIGAMIAQIINGALVGNPVRLLMVASTSLMIAAVGPFLLPQEDYSNRPLDDDLSSKNSGGDPADEEVVRLNEAGFNAQGPYLRIKGGYQNPEDDHVGKTIV
jgi:MFS family permease